MHGNELLLLIYKCPASDIAAISAMARSGPRNEPITYPTKKRLSTNAGFNQHLSMVEVDELIYFCRVIFATLY